MNAALAFAHTDFNSYFENQPDVFGASADPTWLKETQRRINELRKLSFNWDHQNASPLDENTVRFAVRLLEEALNSDTPTPQIFPLPSGGVQIEWHVNQIDFEIEVSAPFEVYVSYENHRLNRELETELIADFTILREPISQLSVQ